jgi:hypothetical protein
MHVEFDDVGPCRKGGAKALDGVLEKGMLRREDPLGGAGFRGQAVAMIGLAEPRWAMISGRASLSGARRLVLRRKTAAAKTRRKRMA